MNDSYRGEFEDKTKAASYEQDVFSSRSYATLLWSLERRYLSQFLKDFPILAEDIDYLDFACGTGRILSFMESRVGKARGIEISAAMLDIARQKVRRAELVHADITAANVSLEGRYDLITAFRFLLNAEPDLRSKAMQGLAARLKDERSRLVFNVQASLPSHKLVPWLKHRLWDNWRKQQDSWNYVTRAQVYRLAAEAGLEIETVFGYDLISSKGLSILSYNKLLWLEQELAGKPLVQRLGGHQMYVAKRRF